MEIKNTFLHSGYACDTIASLPSLKEFYNKTGIKPILYLQPNVKPSYHDGGIQLVKDEETGEPVMLNKSTLAALLPLLKEQSYLGEVKEFEGEEAQHDFGRASQTNVMSTGLDVNRAFFYMYPDLSADLTLPWLSVPHSETDYAKGKIIITRSERLRNDAIDYSFLKKYENDLVFSGTMREWNNFAMTFDINIKKLPINNFLQLAQAIRQSRFHLSNQSVAFQMSSGMCHPRLLEVFPTLSNMSVNGPDAHDFLFQEAAEYYFQTLYDKTK